MSEKADKPEKHDKPAGKLILFNNSRNAYILGKNEDGSRRMFAIGASIECKDQAEYDRLRGYRGVSTTAQVAPGLNAHLGKLESEKAELQEKVASLEKQLEKYTSKKER